MKRQQKDHVFLAKLKEECWQNFDGELEPNKLKIIGFHVPQVPVPEWLVHLP